MVIFNLKLCQHVFISNAVESQSVLCMDTCVSSFKNRYKKEERTDVVQLKEEGLFDDVNQINQYKSRN